MQICINRKYLLNEKWALELVKGTTGKRDNQGDTALIKLFKTKIQDGFDFDS